jgi:hypothetical protein
VEREAGQILLNHHLLFTFQLFLFNHLLKKLALLSISFSRKILFVIFKATVKLYFLLNLLSVIQHCLSAACGITALHFSGVNQIDVLSITSQSL